MAAAVAICGEDEPAAAEECAAAGGGVERLDLGDGRAALVAGGKRSVYLMECEPVWGCVATPGRGGEMEDACAAVPRFADVPVRLLARRQDLDRLGLDADALRLPSHLFAVFDGHGGSEVSNYCRERLHVVLSKELRKPPKDLGEMSDVDMKEHWDDLFTKCFQTVDDEVSGLASRLVDGEPRSDPIAAENVGSTAVAAVVCSSHVVVANCGDSRIVLSRGKEPVALSIDQKPDRKDERARIEAAGGKVIQWNGHRVSGILAMSRSIGDRYLKPYIIPKPEVTVVPRAKDDDCLILASDGLWDVMSNEEACKVARRQIQQWHKNNSVTTSSSDGGDGSTDPAAQAAADYLTRLALKKGSQDNITVIVVDLKPRRKPKPPRSLPAPRLARPRRPLRPRSPPPAAPQRPLPRTMVAVADRFPRRPRRRPHSSRRRPLPQRPTLLASCLAPPPAHRRPPPAGGLMLHAVGRSPAPHAVGRRPLPNAPRCRPPTSRRRPLPCAHPRRRRQGPHASSFPARQPPPPFYTAVPLPEMEAVAGSSSSPSASRAVSRSKGQALQEHCPPP